MQADSFTQIYQKLLRSGIPLRAPSRAARILPKDYAGDFFQGIAIPESISRQEQPEKLALCHRKESMAVRAAKEKDQPIDDAACIFPIHPPVRRKRLCGRMSICASTGFSIT